MKYLINIILLTFFINGNLLSQRYAYDAEINAKIQDVYFNSVTERFEITYDILNASSNDLYLVELEYYEYKEVNIIKPTEGSIYGEGGENAVRGGRGKKII